MDLYSDTDAPHIDYGVLAELKRVDPDLRLSWSKWSINPFTSRPIMHRGNPVREPYPMYHLWVKDPDGRWNLVQSYHYFDHRCTKALEADAARHMSPKEILAAYYKRRGEIKEKEARDFQEGRTDIAVANKSRIRDHFDMPGSRSASSTRDAKLFSYKGKGNLGGGGGTIRKSDREDGWEKPDQ